MLQLVKTADGSNTIFNPEVGENYHSKHGALQESKLVFITSGLQYYLSLTQPSPEETTLPIVAGVSILEVGFGTGLNFLLSADFCIDEQIYLDYTGIEAYPLNLNLISKTGYNQYASPILWKTFIANYEQSFREPVNLSNTCKLKTENCKLLNFTSNRLYDIIYFDAFAAVHQPEMWNDAAIDHTIQFLKPGGIFVTYAITGNLKRAVKALGCTVEKAKGAPGKREMLRAIKS